MTTEVVIQNVCVGGIDILYTKILPLYFGKVKYKKKGGGPEGGKERCQM